MTDERVCPTCGSDDPADHEGCPGSLHAQDRDPERRCPTCDSNDPANHDYIPSNDPPMGCPDPFHQPLPEQGEGSEPETWTIDVCPEHGADPEFIVIANAGILEGFRTCCDACGREAQRIEVVPADYAQAEHEKRLEAEKKRDEWMTAARANYREAEDAVIRAETAEQERDEARQHYRATNDAYIASRRMLQAVEQRVATLTSALTRLLALTEEIAHYTPGYVAEDENGDPKFAPIREARSTLADTKEESS